MTQPDLFAAGPVIRPTGPTEAKPRLARQALGILNRLQYGPATNRELSHISLQYTRRISDLRANGYEVTCYQQHQKTGEAWYRLEGQ